MGKKYRSLLALLLAAILVMQPFSGLAAEKMEAAGRQGSLELIQRGSPVSVKTDSGSVQRLAGISDDEKESIKETLYTGLYNLETTIDVSEYEISFQEFSEVLQNLLNTSPELFYVGKAYSYYIFSADSELAKEEQRISSLIPEYEKNGTALSDSDIENMRSKLDVEVNQILSKVNPEWSDREKALFIHDYLASQYEYDTRDPKSEEDPCEYDMYSLLVEGRAVCEGYSLTFLYFMKQLGIPCTTVPSPSMDHMWNQIQLDGAWYHVDVTADDSLNLLEQDMPGKAEHTYFLLSDSALTAQGYVWDTAGINVCGDTTYDSYFWKNSESPILSDGTNWFYVINAKSGFGIYRWNPVTDPAAESAEKLVDLSSYKWMISTDTFYENKYTRIAIHGGKIYFNTPDSILCFAADAAGVITGEPASEITATISGTVYGIRLSRKTLEYITAVPTAMVVDGKTKYVIEPNEPQSACTFETPDATYPPLPTPTLTPVVTPAVGGTSPTPAVTPAGEESTSVPTTTPTVTPAGGESTSVPATTPMVTPAGGESTSVPTTTPTVTPGVVTGGGGSSSGEVTQNPDVSASSVTALPVNVDLEKGTTENEVSSEENGTESKIIAPDILSQIKISASKGKKKITVRTPKKVKTVIELNRKILLNKKKKCKKLTISASKNKTGKLSIKLSSKLKKKMKVSVTVYVAGKKYKKTVKV